MSAYLFTPPPSRAVFLSYASQDAEAAHRIADALRTAGVEVWFDQSDLVGGDAWDQKIRKQIRECALFVPVISANTNARSEGYFRREWKLAVERTHDMADDLPFLVPVALGGLADATARVPDRFREVQWTRMTGEEVPAGFGPRVARLLSGGAGAAEPGPPPARPASGAGIPDYLRETTGTAQESDAGWAKRSRAAYLRLSWPARLVVGTVLLGAGLGVGLQLVTWWEPHRLVAVSTAPGAEAEVGRAPALTEAEQLVARAEKIFEDGDELNLETYTLTEELLQRALALEVTNAEASALYSRVCRTMVTINDSSNERRELMRTHAERAIKLAPESVNAQLAHLDMLLFFDWNAVGVEGRIDALAKQAPGNWRVARLQGRARSGREDLPGAVAAYERAQHLSGQRSSVTADLANALLTWQRYAEAEAVLAAAAAEGKSCGRLFVFDAFLKLNWRGDPAAAAAAVEHWPSWLLTTDRGGYMAGTAYLWAGMPARALATFERLPRDYIRDGFFTGPRALLTARARDAAGQVEAARSDWLVALQRAERELEGKPGETWAANGKAWALARSGQNALALTLRRELVERGAGRSMRLWDTAGLASLAVAAGDPDAAVAELRERVGEAGRSWPRGGLTANPLLAVLGSRSDFQAIVARAPVPTVRPAATPAGGDDKSVAVLAFANLSEDRNNEYFSDGISEELLNVLAKVPGLKVSARTSAFHFKGKGTPIPEIAKQLGVAYVVEGSVRKQGDKVRITAQLIKAADGFHMWSDTFTRELKDIFAVQDEIAGLIARNLSVKLGADFTASTVVNPQAFELYMQGRQAWNLRSPEGFARAEQLLNRAIEVSPDFSRAQVALADVAMIRGENAGMVGAFGQRNSPELAGIVAQIQRVLALDPELAEAHASLGNAYCLGWNFVEAERSLRRAIALNPNYATAHQWLAFPLYFMGRVDEALSEQNRAAELDPLSPRILDNLGHGLRRVGRYREALAVFDQALALQPNWPEALGGKALTYVALGRSGEAVALARQLPAEKSSSSGFQVLVFGQVGLRAEAGAILARWNSGSTWSRVQSLLAIGQQEEALAALDASQERLEPEHCDVLLDPLFDPIRDDPRFAKFIATLGWTEAHARAQAWRSTHPPEKRPAT